MVIKGNARAGAKSLAEHVLRVDTNERVEVAEIRGVVAADILGALREMEAVAVCTNTGKPMYHASINTRAEEKLTDLQRMWAIDALEENLGLTGQPRVVIVHEKLGREHCHIIWSRTDIDHSRAIRMDHNYRTHELVARQLEREFGHERVQGAHVERKGRLRPERTAAHYEMQQAVRTGISPQAAKRSITETWRATDNGQSFKEAIEAVGWLLARGEKRDFVLIDPRGGVHSLARRVEGAKVKDVRARLRDLDPLKLPSVEAARGIVLERLAQLEAKKAKRLPPAPGEGLGWADHGGMVEQQRSARRWAKEALAPPPFKEGKPPPLRVAQNPPPGLFDADETGRNKDNPTEAKSGRGKLEFFEDREGRGKDKKPDKPARGGGLEFFEDKNPDPGKDHDRDR